MIKPYMAVGLSPTIWGVRKRNEIKKNLDHIRELIAAASWLSSLDLPIKLVVIPEGGLQGFTDEIFDMDHTKYAKEIAIDIPGEETDILGEIASEHNIYLVATAKAKEEEFPDRFFNNAFIIDPRGKVILRHRKNSPLFPVEHSICPHDVWDEWVKIHGKNLQAFFPVVDTKIGRLGCCLANEGSYPEYIRGLAMNGAEVVCRPAYPEPLVGNEAWEIQNRARALDNNIYMVAPNLGTYYLTTESETPIDTFGGGSMIVDFKGRIVSRHSYGAGSSYCAGVIDIEALRDFRSRSPLMNWMKDLRTELCQLIYGKPIYPKNLWLDRTPMKHDEYRQEVIEKQIQKMYDEDIWTPPSWKTGSEIDKAEK
jgi:predicted amidohydrolase